MVTIKIIVLQFHPEEYVEPDVMGVTCQTYFVFLNNTSNLDNNHTSGSDSNMYSLETVETLRSTFAEAGLEDKCSGKSDDTNFTQNTIVANVTQNVTSLKITPSWLRLNYYYYNIYCIGNTQIKVDV